MQSVIGLWAVGLMASVRRRDVFPCMLVRCGCLWLWSVRPAASAVANLQVDLFSSSILSPPDLCLLVLLLMSFVSLVGFLVYSCGRSSGLARSHIQRFFGLYCFFITLMSKIDINVCLGSKEESLL